MCGTSRVLSSALRVNAYKTADVANGLHTALVSWDDTDRFSDIQPSSTSTSATDRRYSRNSLRPQVTVTSASVVQDLKMIQANSLAQWAFRVLHDIEAVNHTNEEVNENDDDLEDNNSVHKTRGSATRQRRKGAAVRCYKTSRSRMVRLGFGFNVRQIQLDYNRLDMKRCAKAYAGSPQRLILLQHEKILQDINATGLTFKKGITPRLDFLRLDTSSLASSYSTRLNARQSSSNSMKIQHLHELRNVLIRLTEDSKNNVCILSAGSRHNLTHIFGDIPQLALVAESGYAFRCSTHRDGLCRSSTASISKMDLHTLNNGWTCTLPLQDSIDLQDTLERVARIVRQYCDRTNGAVLLQSSSMVCFDYFQADPEYGDMQATSLQKHLTEAFSDESLRVVVQDLCLTVTHTNVSYLRALAGMYGELPSANTAIEPSSENLKSQRFCLAVGTKRFNPIFKALFSRQDHAPLYQHYVKAYTVTTAQLYSSEARYFVDDTEDVRAVLSVLANLSSKLSRSVSTAAVSSMGGTRAIGTLFQKAGAGALGGFTTKESLLDLRQSSRQKQHGSTFKKGSWGSLAALATNGNGGIPVGPPPSALNRISKGPASNSELSKIKKTSVSQRKMRGKQLRRQHLGIFAKILHFLYALWLRIWKTDLLQRLRSLIIKSGK